MALSRGLSDISLSKLAGMARLPICCVLPPRLLQFLALRGTDPQRKRAIFLLDLMQSMRLTRAARARRRVRRLRRISAALGMVTKNRTIYDAKNEFRLPGEIVIREGDGPTGDREADEAYDFLGATWDLYHEQYGRNSLDDRGMTLRATVHFGAEYDNAFWDGSRMVFGDGDNELFEPFTRSIDVVAHELTHGVIEHDAGLIYFGQAGALNESIADVFGSLVKQYRNNETAAAADWLIGEGLFVPGAVNGVALRSLKDPGSAYNDPVLGDDDQPSHMSDYKRTLSDNGGVHTNSGIPNHAFYLAATAIGGYAWERAGLIWYEALRDRALRPTSGFLRFARLTVLAAARLYGPASMERDAVRSAWNDVVIAV